MLHSYTTAFLWASLIFVVGAVVAGLVLKKGNLATLAGSDLEGPTDTRSRGRHPGIYDVGAGQLQIIQTAGAGR